jgi:hypothetical protein
MERYFDAHLYFANWGTHRLMLRVPLARVDEKRLRAYFRGGGASSRIPSDHVVFDFQSDTESPEDFTEFPGSLAALSPLRAEIVRSDLRVVARPASEPRGIVGPIGADPATTGGAEAEVGASTRRHPRERRAAHKLALLTLPR